MTRSGKAILTAAALVFMVGACGSSSSKSNSLNPQSNGGNSSSSGSNGSFADLVGKSDNANIKITYKTDKDGNEFTLIQRGKDTVYKSGDTSIFNVGGKTTSCQGTGSDATCTEIPGTGSLGSALGSGLLHTYSTLLSTLAKSPLVKDVKTSDQKIAGRDAKCVTLSGALAAAGQSGTVCLDADTGILLSVKSDEGSLFEATSVGSPSDSDFKLPAKPQTITIPSVSIPSYTVPQTP